MTDSAGNTISPKVDIIVHAAGWPYDGPGDGQSPDPNSPLNTIDKVINDRGILWVNAAGNQGKYTWFSDNYQIETSGIYAGYVIFDNTNSSPLWKTCKTIPVHGQDVNIYHLRWDDTWQYRDRQNAQTNIDFWVERTPRLDRRGRNYTRGSRMRKAENNYNTPLEKISFPTLIGDTVCIRMRVLPNGNGAYVKPPWLQFQAFVTADSFGDGLHTGAEVVTTPALQNSSIVNPSESSNSGMIAVGAANLLTPTPAIPPLTDYSSRGPVLTVGSRTRFGRTKPDIVAGSHSRTFLKQLNDGDEQYFGGTSAATGHMGGLAALAVQWFKRTGVSYTPASLASYIKSNATRPVGQSAYSWGYGFVELPCPSKFVSLSGMAIDSSWDNADCVSARRTAAGSGYTNNKVDFYTFTLTRTTMVHIDLLSSRDAYLYLIDGLNTGGTAFRSSDDNGGSGSTDARIRARLSAGTYTVAATTRSSGQTGSYRLRIADIPRASLSPAPSSVAFRADGRWWQFTVNANVPVKVVANPGSVTKRVEITSSATSSNYCPPEQNDTVHLGSGQAIRLAGCVAGTGRVQLRDALNNRLLVTYTFTISRAATTRTSRAGTTSTTSTPAPVVQLQCLSISSIAGSRASSGTFVYLSWRNPTGGKSVSGRQIDIRKWVGGSNGQWNFERYITVGRTSTSAYHIGTAPASYYAYRIRSQCAGSSNSGWSSWKLVAPHSGASGSSDGASQEPEPTPGASAPPDDDARHDPPEDVVQPASETNTGPSQPSGLTAAYADGAVTLSWTPGSSPHYVKQVVKRRERGVRPEVWTDFELDVAANTYTDATVAAGKTYIYRVKGLRDNGRGGDSNRATVTIP